jgi:hypothetical protein
MDHQHIETHSLIERYHQGRLEPEEEIRFEAHLAGCPQCQDQLEMARDLQLGLRAMVAEDAARATSIGAGAWLLGRNRMARLGLLLSSVAIIVLLPLGGYLVARHTPCPAITEVRAAVKAWQQRYKTEHRELASLRSQIATTEEPTPLVNTPVLLLMTVRTDKPAAVIDLDEVGDHVALAADVGNDPRFLSYGFTIVGSDGTMMWHRHDLLPNALEVVMVVFPSDLLLPGDYRLIVEGLTRDAAAVELESYRYLVLPRE